MPFFKSENEKKDYLLAFYCLPALAIIYIIGLWSNHLFFASIAAGGALNVGFGANKKLIDYPLAPMIIAGLGMSFSAWLGSLAGNIFPIFVALCILYSVLCALSGVIDQNFWWILLQWSITFFVSGYFPGNMTSALERGGLVLAGGTIQFLFILFFLRKLSFRRNLLNIQHIRKVLVDIHFNIDKKIHFNIVGVQAGLAIIICMTTVHLLELSTGFWSLMTTLIVLKPNFQNTYTRAKDRILGTLIGILIADLLVLICDHPYLIITEILITAFLGYALASKPYKILTTFITICAVLMFSLNGQPEFDVALLRIFATIIGGMASLIAMALSEYWCRGITKAPPT